MWVSEFFPETAKQVDDLSFIRLMQAGSNYHAPASYQMHTGDIRAGEASLGSRDTYGLGTMNLKTAMEVRSATRRGQREGGFCAQQEMNLA